MKRKLLWIAALALLFTPVTTVTMPNPAAQTPAKFQSFRQMKRYFDGIEKHGIKGLTAVISDGNSEDMYFYRDGRRCRL